MKLELSRLFSHGCDGIFKVFKINGIEADINDFGMVETEELVDFGCSRLFIPSSFTRSIRDKYKINQREFIQIADRLKHELTMECDWCL